MGRRCARAMHLIPRVGGLAKTEDSFGTAASGRRPDAGVTVPVYCRWASVTSGLLMPDFGSVMGPVIHSGRKGPECGYASPRPKSPEGA